MAVETGAARDQTLVLSPVAACYWWSHLARRGIEIAGPKETSSAPAERSSCRDKCAHLLQRAACVTYETNHMLRLLQCVPSICRLLLPTSPSIRIKPIGILPQLRVMVHLIYPSRHQCSLRNKYAIDLHVACCLARRYVSNWWEHTERFLDHLRHKRQRLLLFVRNVLRVRDERLDLSSHTVLMFGVQCEEIEHN